MNDTEAALERPIASDPLWRMAAYRLSVEALRLSWEDATRPARDGRCRGVADQLHRAVGSIGANIAEGYGRGGGRDRARFLEYALGSPREARHWQIAGVHVLGATTCTERIDRLDRITRLLLVMVRTERARRLGAECRG